MVNGNAAVKASTKQKVQIAIAQLGYVWPQSILTITACVSSSAM
ncbi:hypothetical protein [Primorskyibacter sp. S187A]